MNEKKLPFEISRRSWGNFSIKVDKIENIRYSSKAWYCDAFTLSEEYDDKSYGKIGDYKIIGCAGCYQWRFTDNEKIYNENLLPELKKHHDRGLKYQKAGKEYKCFYCKKKISKGNEYERYSMRSAGEKNLLINEIFCLGHRDEMREVFFKKSIDKIKFQELIDTWNKGIII
jgi:hypothetical protein